MTVVEDINDNILGIDFMHTHKLNYNSTSKQITFAHMLTNALYAVKEVTIQALSSMMVTTATSALTLSMYNTVQISKLETAIEAKKQKTDLLADIVKLHEQHLHQLDEMIEDIGNEIKKLKVQNGFHFSINWAIA